jgi:hypothetical protein
LVIDGEVKFLEALVEALMSSRPGGFDMARELFLVEGLGGFSTFGDSLPGALFFVGEAEGMS